MTQIVRQSLHTEDLISIHVLLVCLLAEADCSFPSLLSCTWEID